MTDASDVTSLEITINADYTPLREGTCNETSCFHTGLFADIPPKRPLPLERADPAFTDETGDELLLLTLPLLPRRLAAAAFEPMAPSADMADEAEGAAERDVGVPLTSLSASPVGSLLTNSFCSNWT